MLKVDSEVVACFALASPQQQDSDTERTQGLEK